MQLIKMLRDVVDIAVKILVINSRRYILRVGAGAKAMADVTPGLRER